ncbi:hypothetical protein CFOL_v3_02783 [Cephalotus follicularis]|uniref:Uncharacterized protein n=1 Tax=Cephalotus follicularis TaxID=3775 RepID=A0A1Q3AUJ7_CEPFO|nr:hypothetical protein CFOL_v3_02783 [Cephalotus follicularis]
MGCCVSTKKDNVGSESLQLQKQKQKPSFSDSRAPPPSVLEVETVKEVLSSETPKPKPQQPETTLELKPNNHVQQPDNKDKKNPVFERIKEKSHYNHTTDDVSVTLSEVSEICSVSMSESLSTTTITETRDCEEEVKQRIVARSPAKPSPPPKNRVFGRSPTRRSEQSPGKRNGSLRMVHHHHQGRGDPGHGMVRRVCSRIDPNRKDPEERRSRSPATNRSVMGRSPSRKRVNRSPGRFGSDPTDNRKAEGSKDDNVKWPRSDSANSNANNPNSSSANESLENPLVSLECFIFL